MKNNGDLVKLWVEKAEADLITAVHVLKIKPKPPADISCFHSQQSAEKYIKAAMIKMDLQVQKTHNLEDLIAICSGKDNTFLSLRPEANKLTPYAVEARYPGAMEGISVKEAKEAVKTAEKIKLFVMKKLLK
jgi:HEPN domain-containing protein